MAFFGRRLSKLFLNFTSNTNEEHARKNSLGSDTKSSHISKESPNAMKRHIMSTVPSVFILTKEERNKELENIASHKKDSPSLDLSGIGIDNFPHPDDAIYTGTQFPHIVDLGFDFYKSIRLVDNFIHFIPTSVGKFRNVTRLVLTSNKVMHLPLELTLMESLQMLNLSSNLITSESLESFFRSCGEWTSLVSLNLSFNKLDRIPDPLSRKATRLTHLYLSGNSITSIPISLGSLRYVKVLTLNHNNLASLESLRGMSRLQVVFLDGNERLSLYDLCSLPCRDITLVSLPNEAMDPCKDRLERQFLLKKTVGPAKLRQSNSMIVLESPRIAKSFQPQFNLFDMLGIDEMEEELGNEEVSATPPPPIHIRKTDFERQDTPVRDFMNIAPPTPVSNKQHCFYCNNPITTISSSTIGEDDAVDSKTTLLESYKADSPTEKDVIEDFVSDEKVVSFHASCHALWVQAQEHTFVALDPRQKFLK